VHLKKLRRVFKTYFTILTLLAGLGSCIFHFISVFKPQARVSITSPATSGWYGLLLAIQSLMNLFDLQTFTPKILLYFEILTMLMSFFCLIFNAVGDWVAALTAALLIAQLTISVIWFSNPSSEPTYTSLN
jgi:membrane associated rhomboid family serine protease